MATIGEELRRERLRAGLRIKDAEQALYIRAAYLEALEDDNFSLMAGDVYVKGYLRNYARYLGLDGDAFVSRYKSGIGEIPIAKVRASRAQAEPVKKPEQIPQEDTKRLTYEGLRRRRKRTMARERFFVGLILTLSAAFLVWLFLL